MLHRSLLIVLITLSGMLWITSCRDNPASFEDQPPSLPPASSMEMNFSLFDQETTPAKSSGNSVAQDSSNFNQALFRATIMRLVVELNLAVPRALFEAARNTAAELNEKQEWIWSYSHSAGDQNYEVRLVAAPQGEDRLHWSFYVTSTGLGLDNRLFFEGLTNREGTEGTWTYYDLQGSQQQPVSEISWSVPAPDNVQLRLEILTDRNGHQGDYIEYQFDGVVKHVIYYNSGEDQTTEIQWNTDTHEGYIIAPDYNNGMKSCWNASLENTLCN